MKSSWDIFCKVVDNFGDIGVCWRLARQLAAEHDIDVRLWVDNFDTFARLSRTSDFSQDSVRVGDILVCHWRDPFPEVIPGDVVIEAFACEIPARFQAAMIAKPIAPVWINSEYLSAEKWVAESHRLPSPQVNLTKHFFFPGFVAGTGGLLREANIIAERDRFQRDPLAIAEFWRSLGMNMPEGDELRVSLFCYDNPALPDLLAQWAAGVTPITCVVPDGVAGTALENFFPMFTVGEKRAYNLGNLMVYVIPLLSHERYDRLLWACDMNFVRGEDSFVRGQFAARPFVWQVYPQKDDAHRTKLDAFIDLFCADMDVATATKTRSFWHGWNGDALAGSAWRDFWQIRAAQASHARLWSRKLAVQTDLATNLVKFSCDLLKLRVST